VAASYYGFAQCFLPCPRLETRITMMQRSDFDA